MHDLCWCQDPSDALDSCDGRTEGTFEAAIAATRDLFVGFREVASGRDPDAVRGVMDAWMGFRSDCTEANEYCGNQRWVDLLYEEPTGPYLCAVGWSDDAAHEVFLRLWAVTLFVAWWRVRRRRRRCA